MGRPSHPTGEMPLGVCEPDFVSGQRESFSSLISRGFAPGRWFFCLNCSSQAGSFTWLWHSELPTVVANIRAWSLMVLSSRGSR